MTYMKPLLTGVAICRSCGASWELYRVREDEAVCKCGTPVTDLEDEGLDVSVKEVRTEMGPTRKELADRVTELEEALGDIQERLDDVLEGEQDDEADDAGAESGQA